MSARPGAGRPGRPPLPEHLRARRRMLAWSAPVVLLALIVGGVLLGASLGGAYGRSAYDAGEYTSAAERYDHHKPYTRAVEPWKAWFNAGTARQRAREPFQAVEELREAHRLVPAGTTDADGRPDPATPECRVRTNLSLALEALGDESRAVGDPAMALAYYREALGALGPCTSDGQPPEEPEEPEEQPGSPDEQPPEPGDQPTGEPSEPGDQPTGEPGGDAEADQPTDPDLTEQRQSDKARQAEEEQRQQGRGSGGEPGQADPGEEGPSAPLDPRQRELEERNRDAQRDRQEQEQRSGGGFGGGQNW